MKFVVYCPYNFNAHSGGITALHKLAHNLSNILGEQKVWIATGYKNPKYKGQTTGIPIDDETIVVYPEIINGNPLYAKHVVRWILNSPGIIGGDENTYGANEIYFKFVDTFKVKHNERVKGILTAIETHLDIFHDLKQERFGECYLIRKDRRQIRNAHKENSICIDEYENLGGNLYLANTFNSCELFVCYDNACFLALQSALCGCPCLVVPDGKMTAEQFYSNPFYKYGVAFGEEYLEHAKKTVHLAKEQLLEIEKISIEQTYLMIAKCKELLND